MGLSSKVLVAAFAVTASLFFAPDALADAGDVERRGSCSDTSHWELDLSKDNGGIEVDFEVDQRVAGDVWRVTLKHDGDVFFNDTRTTHADDDGGASFDVERHVDDHSGTDHFVARAVNRSTDEVCRGTASI
jgi:hypothetical protein